MLAILRAEALRHMDFKLVLIVIFYYIIVINPIQSEFNFSAFQKLLIFSSSLFVMA